MKQCCGTLPGSHPEGEHDAVPRVRTAKHGRPLHSYRTYMTVRRVYPRFLDTMWEFARIRTSRPYEQVVDDLAKFPARGGSRRAAQFRGESAALS